MINQTTKDKIEALHNQYINLAKGNGSLLREIALAEIPEMVYNSNAIENSTLSLEDTEKILSGGNLERKVTIREVFEAKRQTIPAFRLREKWMIAQEYNPSES